MTFTARGRTQASPRLELGLEAGVALAVALAAWQAMDRAMLDSLREAAASDKPIFTDVM
jgi:hypothetical protein